MFINNFRTYKSLLVKICFLISLIHISGCSTFLEEKDGAPLNPIDLSHLKEPIPVDEPLSKYGNPDTYKVLGKRYYTLDKSKGFKQTGLASWYGTKFHGKRTSSGEPYDMYALTGAHKTLPLPTYAKITNKANNKSIIVKINDRGPFHSDRIVDLSYAAASKLGLLGHGTAHVELAAIDPKTYNTTIRDLAIVDKKNNKKSTVTKNLKTNKTKTSKKSNTNTLLDKDNLITLQIGSFQDRKKALILTHKVSSILNHPVNINNKDKNIYRVFLGPFPVQDTEVIKTKLARLKILDPISVNKT